MSETTINEALYGAMKYRCIGPHRAGRVVAVSGVVGDRETYYFGSTGGGVWKSTDDGVSWRNVSDGFFKWASVGALAVAPSDPNVIYAGMGETSIRSNVSRGDGVYKSTDAGKTWRHMGLADTQNIGEIVIHPNDPDCVYLAALGHVWGPNNERGVYRTTDGGETWERVLYKSDKAGVVDLAMDPNNPRILYAAVWEASRGPHFLSSGGEDSGLWRSFDGGDSWEDITRNSGLPSGEIIGKIGITASGAREGRVYAIVEAEDGAVFKSDDYGDTWTRGSEDRNLRQRAWYYHHIYADPNDPDTVWVLNVNLWRSIDGGKTFESVSVHHGDTHDLWIDPDDSQRILLGDDGGAQVSFTGGTAWSNNYNQATAEFYHVTVDNQIPYRVYGAQQDNTTMSVPSRSNYGAITEIEWYPIGGGESGYIAVNPDNPDIVYAGSYGGLLTRYDASTRLAKAVNVWPEMTLGSPSEAMKYRFQWTSPTVFSPHDTKKLYHGGNHVFLTENEGTSWKELSPDLTRRDEETLVASGGPITRDNTGAETYATVFAIAESPVKEGIIWAGSDDGLIWVSKNGGKGWDNVTPGPDQLPEWPLISIIEPSPHDAATAYVAATRYKSHDDAPYLFKTDDYGETWTAIVNGIPEGEFTRAIREDPVVQGLLFAGTEQGLWVSFNDGADWQSLQLNLPVTPIHDFVIAQDDLVVATHGRSFWILDDITPLRQLATGDVSGDTVLFRPRDTRRFASSPGFGRPPQLGRNFRMAGGVLTAFEHEKKADGEGESFNLDAGENPVDGVVVQYYFASEPADEVTLTFKDGDGKEIRSFGSKKPDKDEDKKDPVVAAKSGANRFVWDFRYPGPVEVPDDTGSMGFAGTPQGPKAVPGSYIVELSAGGETITQEFEILGDARTGSSQKDYEAGFKLAMNIRDTLSDTHTAVNTLRSIRKQVESWTERVDDEDIKQAAEDLKVKLREVEDPLIQWRAKSTQDTLNFPVQINAKLAALLGQVVAAEGRPTDQAKDVYEDLKKRVDAEVKKLDDIVNEDVKQFNKLVRESGTPPVSV